MMLGENRFVYDEECKVLIGIPEARRDAMMIIGEFPIKRPDGDGGYGWVASELADWADYYAFMILARLYPEKYLSKQDNEDDE